MTQRDLLEAEIVRLQDLRASLDHAWPRVRWFVLGLPLAIAAGFMFGVVWFWLGTITTLSFLATAAYLIRVRRNEYTNEIKLVRSDIRASRRRGPKPARGRP